jgi:hypothetical protein
MGTDGRRDYVYDTSGVTVEVRVVIIDTVMSSLMLHSASALATELSTKVSDRDHSQGPLASVLFFSLFCLFSATAFSTSCLEVISNRRQGEAGLHLPFEKSQPAGHRRLHLGLVLLQEHGSDELEDCRRVAQAVDLLLDALVFLALRFQRLQLLDVLGYLWMALESAVNRGRRTLLQLLVLLRQRRQRLAWISHFHDQTGRCSVSMEISDSIITCVFGCLAGCCAACGLQCAPRPGLLGSGMINTIASSDPAPFLSSIPCLHVGVSSSLALSALCLGSACEKLQCRNS